MDIVIEMSLVMKMASVAFLCSFRPTICFQSIMICMRPSIVRQNRCANGTYTHTHMRGPNNQKFIHRFGFFNCSHVLNLFGTSKCADTFNFSSELFSRIQNEFEVLLHRSLPFFYVCVFHFSRPLCCCGCFILSICLSAVVKRAGRNRKR